jgi:hypothetical protein
MCAPLSRVAPRGLWPQPDMTWGLAGPAAPRGGSPTRTTKNVCQKNKKLRYRNAELVFNSAALTLGDGKAVPISRGATSSCIAPVLDSRLRGNDPSCKPESAKARRSVGNVTSGAEIPRAVIPAGDSTLSSFPRKRESSGRTTNARCLLPETRHLAYDHFLPSASRPALARISHHGFGRAGLVGRVEDWRCSGVNEYSGMSAAQPMRRGELTIASLPLDSKARIWG